MAHVNPKEASRRSKAHYNFVRLPNQPKLFPAEPPPKDKFSNEHYSGHIHFTITTKTDLYVRCAPHLDKVEQENDTDSARLTRREPHRQDFFHHGNLDEPVIPGSSLRGMIRNLIAIFSQSGMHNVSDKRLIYRAVFEKSSLGTAYQKTMLDINKALDFNYPSTRLKAGYLERKGSQWEIKPAQEPGGFNESFVLVHKNNLSGFGLSSPQVHDIDVLPQGRRESSGHGPGNIKLNFAESSQVATTATNGYVKGKLAIPGKSPDIKKYGQLIENRVWFPVIFDLDTSKPPIKIDPELRDLYVQDEADTRRGLPKRTLKDGDPVFYVLDASDKLVFFGPCMMFRIPHKRRMNDAIPNNLQPHYQPNQLDLIERMFGIVRKEEARVQDGDFNILMGRITFHDAHWDHQGGSPFTGRFNVSKGNEQFGGRETPKILSSPKPTAFQHYLEQPKPDKRETLVHWSHDTQPKIRGYKLYWHRKLTTDETYETQLKNDPQNTQHTVIRPVKEGVTFHGKISFENLELYELGALLTALELPNGLCHKLGMGKPYGLGSVKIELGELAMIDHEARYGSLFESNKLGDGVRSYQQGHKNISNCKELFSITAFQTRDIWSIERFRDDLKLLLDFDNPPPKHETDPLPAPSTQNRIWSDRRVLPDPRGVWRRNN